MTHAQAREIVRAAFQRVHGRAPSDAEATYAQAVAFLETGYGRAGQFGALAAQGAYNWGALERARNADGSCPAGTMPGSDVGEVCFYVFPDDVSAATAFVRTLTVGSGRTAARGAATLAAMRGGSPEDVATAMRVPLAYYEGRPGTEASKVAAYAGAIRRSIQAAGNSEPSGGSSTSAPLRNFAIVALAGLAIYGFAQMGGFRELERLSRR